MEWLVEVVAGVVGALLGYWFPSIQHRCYRETAFREDPATGARLLALRAFAIPIGAIVAALSFRPGQPSGIDSWLTASFGLVLVAVSSTDFDRRRIPNVLVYPAMLAALIVAPFWSTRQASDLLLGGAAGSAFGIGLYLLGTFAGAAVRSKETAFGIGDVKLIVLIGLLVGWPAVLPALVLGIFAAGGVAAVLLFLRGRGVAYSYGPYLAAGAVVVMLWYDRFD